MLSFGVGSVSARLRDAAASGARRRGRAHAQAQRDRPGGLRLLAVDAALHAHRGRLGHPHERVAELRAQHHLAGEALADPRLPRLAADEHEASTGLLGKHDS
jgi:hypothetical protein